MSYSDTEKHPNDQISAIENVSITGAKGEAEIAAINAFTPKARRSIIRRVDRRLVTTLGLLYAVSLMDRTNLGNASIAGMSKDLKLNIEPRYSVISLVFFITYTLFQPVAVVILRKSGPRNFLSTITFTWGIIMLGCAFVKNWTSLVALRIILGVLEAGLFPGCAYILSTWYPRYELQKRNAAFYLVGTMVSSFTSILAYGISCMDGIAHMGGWRWIFLIQGLISCLASVVAFFVIVDFPEKAARSRKFINEAEAAFITARIQLDRQDVVVEPFHLGTYLKGAADLKIWGFAALFGFTTVNTYAISYFLPLM